MMNGLCKLVLLTMSVLACAQSTRVALPSHRGALVVRTDNGFQVANLGCKPNDEGIRFDGKAPGQVNVTIFLEQTHGQSMDAIVTSEWSVNRVPAGAKRGKVEVSSSANSGRVEYTDESYNGMTIQMRSRHDYLGGGEVWGEVHMSKLKWEPADQKTFDDISGRFKIDPDYQPTSSDAWIYASCLYKAGNYPQAAAKYELALQKNDSDHALDSTKWHVLVDNLGMSYGISHDLPKAQATFEKGIAADPQYPMFYYEMACVYGEQNDMENSIKYLQLAFDRRTNVLRGESLPDPLKDDSFKSFWKEKRFKEFVGGLGKG